MATTTDTGDTAAAGRPAKPYRLLYVVAAVLALAGIVTAAVLLFNRPSTAGTNPPVPPPVISTSPTPSTEPNTSTPTPSPSSTPTLSAKQQAADDAQAAYVAYIRARDEMSQAGSSAAAEAKALLYTTANERAFLKKIAKDNRDQKIRRTGYAKVTTRVESLDLKANPPTAQLTACLDQSEGVTATKAGKPITPPKFIKQTVDMQKRGDRWLVALTSTPDTPDERNRTSCTA